MDNKPVVTYAGDFKLFSELQAAITQGLPQECIEWRRSFGRVPKPVVVEVSFTQFNENRLSAEKSKSLLGQPFLHTYWLECSDVEKYKQSVRNDISSWFASLRSRNVQDWMIIVVEHLDNKRVNKTKLLSRTTVLEKLKNDFPSKNGERCVSLLDPFRSDSRAAVSLNGLLLRLRQLLLQAYSNHLNWYEERVRNQREKRNEIGWDFLDFFFLQEELAFAFEMMGVYDDAVVQYDELDALFSQFVINSTSSEIPEWLTLYTKPVENWPGVCLSRDSMPLLRKKLSERKGSLLDLRSYLFSRQCSLLLLLCRPWEMAQRSLPFLHNCVNELRILEIPAQTGATATWVFLSCLEILQSCERFSDSSQVEAYSLYTVELWAYAREKLRDLGVLCGLMPLMEATSEQLHLVMVLTSGMSDRLDEDENPAERQLRLREALSSKEAFLSNYLEISELTMGTYKHIGRIRSARLIGKDLAPLYYSIGQTEKAASFLNDMLQIYYRENWSALVGETQLQLASFYENLQDIQKYVKMCLKIAANDTVEPGTRRTCFENVLKHQNYLGENGKKLTMKTDRIFRISGTKLTREDDPLTSENKIEISLNIESLLPSDITGATVSVSFVKETYSNVNSVQKRSCQRNEQTNSSKCRWNRSSEDKPFTKEPLLEVITSKETKEDGTLVSKVSCTNSHQVLFRRDSHTVGLHRDTEVNEDDYSLAFVQSNVKIHPGKTLISISKTGVDSGVVRLTQLRVAWDKIHLLYSYPSPAPSVVIVHEPPTIKLQSQCGTPIAGLVQRLELTVSSGSSVIAEGSSISVKTSQGLYVIANEPEEWSTETVIDLPNIKRFNSVKIPFNVLAEFGPQRDASMIEYRIALKWTLSAQVLTVPFHFLPPFMTAYKLHTCNLQKFLQVFVHGLTNESFSLCNASLSCLDKPETKLEPLNNTSQEVLIVNTDQTALFLWKIDEKINAEDTPPSKFLFRTNYQSVHLEKVKFLDYKYEFKLGEYRTRYLVRASVEPPNGSEFCRAGTTCHMTVKIERAPFASNSVLMYEIIADQSVWSVCGKTAGVMNLAEKDPYSVTFDVIPLTGGFLPLPTVRLSKYIPENPSSQISKESITSTAKLEPFEVGQFYLATRATQAHVLPAINVNSNEV